MKALSYVDESGHARPNEITGLWATHAAGLRGAENAREVLSDAVSPAWRRVWVDYRLDRAAVAEHDEWGANRTLTAWRTVGPKWTVRAQLHSVEPSAELTLKRAARHGPSRGWSRRQSVAVSGGGQQQARYA
ncbi:hypothetical protein Val02_92760 [Virgisporangium aliadipatigenens]|uniref:Uncharacterized protein n=1 Tax=Virgisporangium aliadipatigenens TaxID=741659 RepID=A0A8J4DVG6_9ACTN|nr:hypothetical protein [Virgisporangium aliadipatigenens]GIJ52390.1 hypothetical protein Val02_92760 [Virgisporangium aliadipatigenens]